MAFLGAMAGVFTAVGILVGSMMSKWIVGRDFKGKLEAQGKKIETQEKELELRLQRIGEKSEQGWFQRMESRLSALEAEIIWRAPTLEEARRIYEGFRAAPQMRQQVKGNGF